MAFNVGTLGPFASMIPGVGPIAGPALAAAGAIQSSKIPGVPTPSSNGPAEGANYRGFMDESFPGTTPWERLGASTGSVPSASVAAGSGQLMQEKEFRQQRQITDMNNRASVIAAASPYGALARESGLASLYGGRGGNYDTPTGVSRSGVDSEIDLRKSESGLARSGSALKDAQVPGAKADSTSAEYGIGEAKAAAKYAESKEIMDLIGKVVPRFSLNGFLRNSGESPRWTSRGRSGPSPDQFSGGGDRKRTYERGRDL